MIYDEIAKDSPDAASEFIEDLARQIDKLASLGVAGSPRDWIKPGLKAFPYRKRCFYFYVKDNDFILLRVLHGAQDVFQQFL